MIGSSGEKLVASLQRASLAAWGLVALIGAAALWGWAIDLPRLRDFGADFAPMPPAAAFSCVLLAASFLAARRGNARASVVASAVVGLVAALSLVESLLDV